VETRWERAPGAKRPPTPPLKTFDRLAAAAAAAAAGYRRRIAPLAATAKELCAKHGIVCPYYNIVL